MKRIALLLALAVVAVVVPSAGATPPGGPHIPVTICHHAGPHPENWHTIVVDDDAVPAHLAHGDTLGPCPPPPPPPEKVSVCRNGVVVVIDKGTEQPGDTPAPCPTVPPPNNPPGGNPPPNNGVTPPPVEKPETPEQPNETAPKEEERGNPNRVAGKEQTGELPHGSEVVATKTTGGGLPFTGAPLVPLALAGVALALGGVAFRRYLA